MPLAARDDPAQLFHPDEPVLVAPQEVVDRVDSDLDGSQRPIFIDVLERKDRIRRCVMAALEARQLQGDDVRLHSVPSKACPATTPAQSLQMSRNVAKAGNSAARVSIHHKSLANFRDFQ